MANTQTALAKEMHHANLHRLCPSVEAGFAQQHPDLDRVVMVANHSSSYCSIGLNENKQIDC